MNTHRSIDSLRTQIESLEDQVYHLKLELAQAVIRTSYAPPSDDDLEELGHGLDGEGSGDGEVSKEERLKDEQTGDGQEVNGDKRQWRWPLELCEYKRYGRQLVMPEIGLKGQLRLKYCSILIIGLGGLGCPAAAYLAGAGVGTLGLIDGDTVEVSNLHRQILHSGDKVGWRKVDSAAEQLPRINDLIRVVPYDYHLTQGNALQTVAPYDLVLDCTDHPTSRYLISDTCVLLGKPLVSASALRTEGQLMVLNWPPEGAKPGPCYRCVFPKPPPAERVISCGEGGILGPVVGVMGVLQALEAIKIVTSGHLRLNAHGESSRDEMANGDTDTFDARKNEFDDDATTAEVDPPTMLLFSAYSTPPFRTIRLRPRRPNCPACSSTHATITKESLVSESMDYVQFCGFVAPVNVLGSEERMDVTEFAALINSNRSVHAAEDNLEWQRDGKGGKVPEYVLIDVREKPHFELCGLPGSTNVPYSTIASSSHGPLSARKATAPPTANANDQVDSEAKTEEGIKDTSDLAEWVPHSLLGAQSSEIIVVCQCGNDSQLAVKALKELGLDKTKDGRRKIRDVAGGFVAWRSDVDKSWPEY